MRKQERNMSNEESLTSGWYNKFCIAFFGLLLLRLVGSIGQGPFMIDIARLTIIGMAVTIIARVSKPQKVSLRVVAVIETVLLGILIGAGIIGGVGWMVAIGVLIIAIVALSTLTLRLERRAGIRA